ncbi:MAG: hypothetical protein KDD43_13805, partial [Bdellovibrionales bacterium]|nr:hypothetical protein [Bdellovibrionales bacterium]
MNLKRLVLTGLFLALSPLALASGDQGLGALFSTMEKMVGEFKPHSVMIVSGSNRQSRPPFSPDALILSKKADGYFVADRPAQEGTPLTLDFRKSADGKSLVFTTNIKDKPETSWRTATQLIPGQNAFSFFNETKEYWKAPSPADGKALSSSGLEARVKMLANLGMSIGVDFSPYKDGGVALAPETVIFDGERDIIVFTAGLVDAKTNAILVQIYSFY